MTEKQDSSEITALPPHFRCDCVPDLGAAHCHRCSRSTVTPIYWDDSPCRDLVESFAYGVLLANHAESALLLISEAFDAELAAAAEALAVQSEDVASEEVVPTVSAEQTPTEQIPAAAPVDQAPRVSTPAPRPPATRLVSALERQKELSAPGSWRFTNLASDQIAQLNLTRRDIGTLLEAPHVQIQSHTGTAMNHYADGLLMMVDADGECVISVIERETPITLGGATTTNHVVRKAPSGGGGRRMPSNVKEFLALLTEHGFTTEAGGKGHPLVTHPAHPDVRLAVPSTPSDSRSYPNAIAEIKRRTGIDITKHKE
jgi:hypothetical protein